MTSQKISCERTNHSHNFTSEQIRSTVKLQHSSPNTSSTSSGLLLSEKDCNFDSPVWCVCSEQRLFALSLSLQWLITKRLLVSKLEELALFHTPFLSTPLQSHLPVVTLFLPNHPKNAVGRALAKYGKATVNKSSALPPDSRTPRVRDTLNDTDGQSDCFYSHKTTDS